VERRKTKHKTMRIKIITGFLLGTLLASTHLDAEPACKDPKETTICLANQPPLSINGCQKIETNERKNKACTGSAGNKQCIARKLYLHVIETIYERLNIDTEVTAGAKEPYQDVYCGTKETREPRSVEMKIFASSKHRV
jgi:hypothetical protein